MVNHSDDNGIPHTLRDVGPCRVWLASLADRANFQLFLADEEQFANRQLSKNLLRTRREKVWDAGIGGEQVQV